MVRHLRIGKRIIIYNCYLANSEVYFGTQKSNSLIPEEETIVNVSNFQIYSLESIKEFIIARESFKSIMKKSMKI